MGELDRWDGNEEPTWALLPSSGLAEIGGDLLKPARASGAAAVAEVRTAAVGAEQRPGAEAHLEHALGIGLEALPLQESLPLQERGAEIDSAGFQLEFNWNMLGRCPS